MNGYKNHYQKKLNLIIEKMQLIKKQIIWSYYKVFISNIKYF